MEWGQHGLGAAEPDFQAPAFELRVLWGTSLLSGALGGLASPSSPPEPVLCFSFPISGGIRNAPRGSSPVFQAAWECAGTTFLVLGDAPASGPGPTPLPGRVSWLFICFSVLGWLFLCMKHSALPEATTPPTPTPLAWL